ncbi:MAG: hypothetical protein J1F31_06525 [Erysipelotrichales bacterium]|nr:hypothetical protein [Erysipelotrichales bacterium]
MVTREQVIGLMEQLKQNRPNTTLNKLRNSDMGMILILFYLSEHPNTYAYSISKELNISRERVRVLTKKLEEKKLIVKTSSSDNARIELINLTDLGIKYIEDDKEQKIEYFTNIVDKIGYERMKEFINTINDIRKIISKEK